MKVLIGAAAAMLMFAAPAVAQTATPALPASLCAALPPAPSLPDGATANRRQIEAGNTAFAAWNTAYHAALDCRRTETEAIRQAATDRYNGEATVLNTTISTWEAEVAEFNARGNTGGSSRQRGGVLTRPDN